MSDLNEKWYAVPGYKGAPEKMDRDPHVVNDRGELMCVCEGLDIAEQIVRDHNGTTEFIRSTQ